MSTINIKCVDQVLNFENMPIITSGNQNVDKVHFDFCNLWDGFTKVAIFFQQKGELSYSLINADGTCNVPNSIMKMTGNIYICASGTSPNKEVRTTNILSYRIDEGVAEASLMDEFPDEISEEEKNDVYNKMLELSQNIQEIYLDLVRNMAYIHFKDANEFEYDVELFEDRVNKVVSPIYETLESYNKRMNKNAQDIATNAVNIQSNRNYIDTKVGELNIRINDLSSLHETDKDEILNLIRTELATLNAKIAILESKI